LVLVAVPAPAEAHIQTCTVHLSDPRTVLICVAVCVNHIDNDVTGGVVPTGCVVDVQP
jgi:hypothetical protein